MPPFAFVCLCLPLLLFVYASLCFCLFMPPFAFVCLCLPLLLFVYASLCFCLFMPPFAFVVNFRAEFYKQLSTQVRYLLSAVLLWLEYRLRNKFYYVRYGPGDRGSTVVKVLCYKSEGRWFDPRWCQWIFHWHKILPIALWPWGRFSL